MNIITGETGTGKSILIKALHLLLGVKADVDLIRRGRDEAVVTGVFTVNRGHHALEFLAELGVLENLEEETEDRRSLIIRRVMTRKGRSLAWINDSTVTMSTLRQVGAALLDIFAQHENQSLLNESKHNQYVDAFLKDQRHKLSYAKQYRVCMALTEKLSAIMQEYAEKSRNDDYIRYRCDELGRMSMDVDEFESLQKDCREFENFAA